MTLGLSHSLSRYKLKFSPEKVDTMIVQAIGLLDVLDKELNQYSMRVREWYGWHFPELAKVVPIDNRLFCRIIQKMRIRTNALKCDFSDLLTADVESELKEAAQISMGTEISEEDIENIVDLCKQVIDIYEYREELFDYLKNRMQAIAPNLTLIVGELVGARLIAHAGSLINLAKHPASTVQILGAEKALFRALKTKHDTPKYGLIYHASLVGQTTPKNRAKICRLLAAKAALSTRVDALSEREDGKLVATQYQEQVMNRIQAVDKGITRQVVGKAKSVTTTQNFQPPKTYETSQVYESRLDMAIEVTSTTREKNEKDKKKKKRRTKRKRKKKQRRKVRMNQVMKKRRRKRRKKRKAKKTKSRKNTRKKRQLIQMIQKTTKKIQKTTKKQILIQKKSRRSVRRKNAKKTLMMTMMKSKRRRRRRRRKTSSSFLNKQSISSLFGKR
jgi:nucleolar protein 58